MTLKPQDVLFVLKLVALGHQTWTYAWLAERLGMSSSQLHAAAKRAVAAGLVSHDSSGTMRPNLPNLRELCLHGLRYVFVPEHGELTRGIPTAHAAPPLKALFTYTNDPPPVWPYPEGQARGLAFSPLYKLAPKAALADHKLYELLVLIDAIRGGRARERKIASDELSKRLEQGNE